MLFYIIISYLKKSEYLNSFYKYIFSLIYNDFSKVSNNISVYIHSMKIYYGIRLNLEKVVI